MSSCCVPGCRVRRKNGIPVYMARFPNSNGHPQLRQQWIENISKYSSQKAWQPSANALVCEMHFSREMWENVRVDGTKRLKRYSAVPTLFVALEAQHTSNDSENVCNERGNDEATCETNVSIKVQNFDDILTPSTSDGTETSCEDVAIEMHNLEDNPTPLIKDDPELSMNMNDKNRALQNENTLLKRQILMIEAENARQRRQWRNTYACQRKQIIQLKNQQSKIKQALKNMLNDDQIEALTTKSARGIKWSEETIQKSLKLKFFCGSAGYNELLAQNVPLPSTRTLRRKII